MSDRTLERTPNTGRGRHVPLWLVRASSSRSRREVGRSSAPETPPWMIRLCLDPSTSTFRSS